MTKFAIEIHQTMVAGDLPEPRWGLMTTPDPSWGFAGTQVDRAIEKVGNPCSSSVP
jgi:hypothetical protein